MTWNEESGTTHGSLDWVMCRLLVCVPADFLELASSAVLGARNRILHDPLFESSVSIELCSIPVMGSRDSLAGSPRTAANSAALLAEALIESARRPDANHAPGLIFCLLIVNRHLEAEKLVSDLAVDEELAGMPVLVRSFTEVEAYDLAMPEDSAISTRLEHELLRSITSTLEYAGLNREFRIAPWEMARAAPVAPSLRDTAAIRRAETAVQRPPVSVLQATFVKARSQLAAMRAPTTSEAMDQASQVEKSINLLYLMTVTGSSLSGDRNGLKWAAHVARSLTQRVARIENDHADDSSWYVSFLSAGERVERLLPPTAIAAIGRRHLEVKPKGYDFDFFACTRGIISVIERDTASFARRGVAVAEIRTVILSIELPLADTVSIDGYRELCDLSPVTWVLGTDVEDLSSDFHSERSQVLFDHADVVEELVSRSFPARSAVSRDGGEDPLIG